MKLYNVEYVGFAGQRCWYGVLAVGPVFAELAMLRDVGDCRGFAFPGFIISGKSSSNTGGKVDKFYAEYLSGITRQ